ncbi:MAG: AAA family ATPase [Cryomorphaceae bacterium]
MGHWELVSSVVKVYGNMVIERVKIENYKIFKSFDIKLNEDLNIVVGDNETGKSTLLEAINLALTCQVEGRNISYELSPYFFNAQTVTSFIHDLIQGKKVSPPSIVVEVFFKDSNILSKFKGSNNSERSDSCGVRIEVKLDDDYNDDYAAYISKPQEINSIPVEYYSVLWTSFSDSKLKSVKNFPSRVSLIDTSSVRLNNGTDQYIHKTIDDILTKEERAAIDIQFRKLKESFSTQDTLLQINTQLKAGDNPLIHDDISVMLDYSQKRSWQANLTTYIRNIPYQNLGKGEQTVLKMAFALERQGPTTSSILLIDEPENHLSFSRLNVLLRGIQEKCIGQQLIISTHNSFVLNKLGLDRLKLINESKCLDIEDLPSDTQLYFKKLPGYDTLRLVLSSNTILVEGPSDELIVSAAYYSLNKRMPIEDGVDVLSVRGLSFKRFLDIANGLDKNISVVRDNDGDYKKKIEDNYEKYLEAGNVKLFYDKDDSLKTLEDHIAASNEVDTLNNILEYSLKTKIEIAEQMKSEKTSAALKIFTRMSSEDSDLEISERKHKASFKFPKYILSCVQK